MKGVKKLQIVTIIADKHANDLALAINRHIKTFSNEGILIENQFEPSTNTIIYIVDGKTINNYTINDFISLFKRNACEGIYEYIKTIEEPNIIKELINQEYNYFNIDERKEILQRSLDSVNKLKIDKNDALGQKSIILEELVNYFESNSKINLKGFITFRLKDYVEELKIVIDEAVEDFLMDKEYNEFIKLLRYFVDVQEPKVDIVHIYMKEENNYSLFDNYGKEINDEYLRLIAAEMKENDISYDDLLISSLITIAPNNIIIHKTGNNNFEYIINTIKRIFNQKVELCNNCDWCIIKSNVKKD